MTELVQITIPSATSTKTPETKAMVSLNDVYAPTLREHFNVITDNLGGSIRKAQEIAIDAINQAYAEDKKFIILELPTGAGKSFCAAAAASHAKTVSFRGFNPGAYILTPLKSLQQQYLRDFAQMGMKELKGRSNYPCTQFVDEVTGEPVDCEVGATLCKSQKAAKKASDEELGMGDTPDSSCSYCPYKAAKTAFCKSPLGVTNFDYYLNETAHGGQLTPRNMLVIDEGHNTDQKILGLANLVINKKRCDDVDYKFFSIPAIKPGETERGVEWIKKQFKPAVLAKIQSLEYEVQRLAEKDLQTGAAKAAKKLNSLNRFLTGLNLFLNSDCMSDWIVYTDTSNGSSYGCLIVKPLTATMFADKYLFKKAHKVLIMSGTIGNFDFFMRNLDIDPNDAVCVSAPSDFPVENRPIFIKPVGNMGFRTKKEALPLVADALGNLINKYAGKKGIVHTQSFETNRYMIDHLPQEAYNRVITHTSRKGERDEAISNHVKSEGDTILFSPSMGEGLDLKDDLSRFSIMVKVPYATLDPYVKARMNRDPDWYTFVTSLAIIQATGRSNRHKEDKAHHYILDAGFVSFISRAQKFFPQWWLDALVWPTDKR